MEKETFWSLFHDLAHWEFELFLMFVFDVLIGMILWPLLKKFSTHHRSDDQQLLDLQRRLAKMEAALDIKDDKSE